MRDWLGAGLSDVDRRLRRTQLDHLQAAFAGWTVDVLAGADPLAARRHALVHFLARQVTEGRERLLALGRSQAAFTDTLARAPLGMPRRLLVLEHAAALGRTPAELAEDERAFARHFDADAVTDRYLRQFGTGERDLVFVMERMGVVAAMDMAASPGQPVRERWRAQGLEVVLRPLLEWRGDSRVRVAAFHCLVSALSGVPVADQESCLLDDTVAFVYRAALDRRLDVWIQCEALSLLVTMAPASFASVLRKRLGEPGSGDDLFVRRRAVRLLIASLTREPALADLLPLATADPSPAVRQALATAVAGASAGPARDTLSRLARLDPSPQVRAAALPALAGLVELPDGSTAALDLLLDVLQQERDPFVLRTACHLAPELVTLAQGPGGVVAARWAREVPAALAVLHATGVSVPVRRWAAESHERCWCAVDPGARALRPVLSARLDGTRPGGSIPLGSRGLAGADDATVGRVLSVLAQRDFGSSMEPGRFWSRLHRGHRFGLRAWRLLHELFRPSPDKRQAHAHTVGRHFRGRLRAPSSILAELSQTRVPGEPLFLPGEGGWRPYLPLLDEALSVLDGGWTNRTVETYTAEGVTRLTAPLSPLSRVHARLALTFRFAKLARLRNWTDTEDQPPGDFVKALTDLGFQVSFRPHSGTDGAPLAEDPQVRRFFPAVLPLGLNDLWSRFHEYSISAYTNELSHLVGFAAAAALGLATVHLSGMRRLRRARAKIPLVIGGWGTRGKSGTERLKAALFSALGHSVVSKTTGCEAMAVVGRPFGRLHELFLYRPYDKATITEQARVLGLASELGAEVFLWECMALNPVYVNLLQRQWMRDDLSTLTNAYPDHEDIQGPAGIDLAEVMTNFIPERAKLFTSEESMLPVLAEAARGVSTTVRSVGWFEQGLITPDLLARFPYDEHPANVALVLALARELGLDEDFAIKEMADRVVPDLGVLKTFPPAEVDGRLLSFTNGMSANERKACVENWTRLGFDRHDPVADPGTWITTVVNNRADRIPRSQVFAQVMVEDLAVDRHVLIGTNLDGMQSYVRDAWAERMRTFSLWGAASSTPLDALARQAAALRIFTCPEHIEARLAAMLTRLGLPDGAGLSSRWRDTPALESALAATLPPAQSRAILAHVAELAGRLSEYEALAERVSRATAPDRRLDADARRTLTHWFDGKLVVVPDSEITGEQLIAQLAAGTPPGVHNRMLGVQNIKGPGLDFVYRWIGWGRCHRACAGLTDEDSSVADAARRVLLEMTEHGQLTERHLERSLIAARATPHARRERVQDELERIARQSREALVKLRAALSGGVTTGGPLRRIGVWLISLVEAVFEAGHAIRRTRLARQIYTDLTAERISFERAARELARLMDRQQGGWLLEKLESLTRTER